MEIKKNEDRKRICVTVRVNPHVPGPRNRENLELDFVLQINYLGHFYLLLSPKRLNGAKNFIWKK